MSESGKFYAIINFIFVAGFVALVWVCTDYWKDHNTKIVQMINDGVDPVAAMCAMQDDYGNHPTCIVLAAKNN